MARIFMDEPCTLNERFGDLVRRLSLGIAAAACASLVVASFLAGVDSGVAALITTTAV